MAKNQYKKEPLKNNVEEMFIGPFGSSLKNECFVDEEDAYCMVYEQKHAIQKTLDGKNRFVDKNKYYELKRFTIKPGDIIVSCRGTIGETFIVPENAPLGIMHPSIMKIRLKPNVYNIEYFNLLLKNRLKDHNKSANGSGIKMAISATELGKEMFPIPPMDEQQKVSKIFLTVDRLIVLRQQQLSKLDELVKARFVEMFGDPIRNEKGWNTYTLAEMCDGIGDGLHGTPEYDENGEYPFINGNNLISGIIQINPSTKKVNKKTYEKHYIKISQNAILLSINGTLGRIAFYNSEQVMLGKSACYCNLRDEVNRIFVYNIMKTDAFARYLEDNATKSTIKNVGLKAIREYRLIMPPIPLQNQFSSFVERVDQQKQTVQQSLEKLELMKKALMQEYFG